MKAAFLSTGDEVLHGDIIDTNAAWISRLFAEQSLALSLRLTTGDNLSELSDELLNLSQRMDLVVVNGGLGPTQDDLTAQAMAQAAGVALKQDRDWLEKMTAQFVQKGRPMPKSNIKQTMLPQGAQVIDNPIGTACGFYLKLNRAHFYFTPGVPKEFKMMVEQQLLPSIKKRQALSRPILRKRYYTFGLSESWLSDQLDHLAWPKGVALGYRASMPLIELKLVCTEDEVQLARAQKMLLPYIEHHMVSEEGESQAQALVKRLIHNKQSIALAESCTGGAIASALVDVSGSSQVFSTGIVSYSNQAKEQLLQVAPELIQHHGAVSLPVVQAMAIGVKKIAQSDFALAVSGIAGPDGGSEQKPVGTVAFALATPQGCISQLQLLPDRGRNAIRSLSVAIALDMLRRYFQGENVCEQYQFSHLQSKANGLEKPEPDDVELLSEGSSFEGLVSGTLFKQLLIQSVKLARRHNDPLSLVSLTLVPQLGNAKQMPSENDLSSVYQLVAEALTSSLRDSDNITYAESGIFNLILHGADKKQASLISKKIEEKLRVGVSVQFELQLHFVMAQYPLDGESPDELFTYVSK